MNIGRIIREEIGWIENVAISLPYDQWESGKTYKIIGINDTLFKVLDCHGGEPYDIMNYSDKVRISVKETMEESELICNNSTNLITATYANFMDNKNKWVGSIYVIEGMLELSPQPLSINIIYESDDFDWVTDNEFNYMKNISDEEIKKIKLDELRWLENSVNCYGLSDTLLTKVSRWNSVPLRLHSGEQIYVDDILIVDYKCKKKPMSSNNHRVVDPNIYDI